MAYGCPGLFLDLHAIYAIIGGKSKEALMHACS
jgi:hypothetical protein